MGRGFSISIDEDTVTEHLELLQQLPNYMNRVVIETANKLATDAKSAAPRDTGGLANSVRVEVRDTSATVGYTADYAPHVEYGHRQNVGQFVKGLGDDGSGRRLVKPFIPGQNFFRPCVERARDGFRSRIEQAIERAAR